jgi:hypothetical protein
MTANVGSVAFTSSIIFSERDLADSRFSVAMVVIVRAREKRGLLRFLKSRMQE